MRKGLFHLTIGASFFLFQLGCFGEKELKPADNPELPDRGYFMGMYPNPGSGQSEEEAFSQAAAFCEFVPIAFEDVPFYELPDMLSGSFGEKYVTELTRGNGMFPVICLPFFDDSIQLMRPPGMEDVSLSTPSWKERYRDAVLDVVRISKPLYLAVGKDVNLWYERYGSGNAGPDDFDEFVELYEEIYDSVKEICPSTTVFPIFTREVSDQGREADLSVLGLFDFRKVDILIFTSHPHVIEGLTLPSDLPDDYYSKAFRYFPACDFGLIDLTWPSSDSAGGEKGQADFLFDVATRLTRDRGLQLKLLGWANLHDKNGGPPIGLITSEGEEKQAFEIWMELFNAQGNP